MGIREGCTGLGRALLAAALIASATLGASAAPAAAQGTSSISGVVTSAATHTPIQGIEVVAYSTNVSFSEEEAVKISGGTSGSARTNAQGEYTISSLNAESFEVSFGPPEGSPLDFVAQTYDGASIFSEGTPVKLTAGQTASGIDAELQEGGGFAGTVTAAKGGTPIPAAEVCAFGPVGAHPPTAGACTSTGTAGTYTLLGLPSGEYPVVFLAEGFALQYFDHVATAAAAHPVSVTAGVVGGPIDAALEPQSITGSERPGEGLPGSLGGELPGSGASGSGHGPPGSSGGIVVNVEATRIAVTKNGVALVRIACGTGALCHDSLKLSAPTRARVGHRLVRRELTLGTLDFGIRAGATATVRVKLDAAARRALHAHHGDLAASLSLHALGKSSSFLGSVTSVKLLRRSASS